MTKIKIIIVLSVLAIASIGIAANGCPWTVKDAEDIISGSSFLVAPTSLTVTAVTSSQINLSWVDNATNEDGFNIERKVEGGNYIQVATVGPWITPTPYTCYDLGLDSITTYYYRVRVYNSWGSAYSNVVSDTTQELVTATAIAAGHVHTVVVLADGTCRSWGSNHYGKLGDGTTTGRHAPILVPNLGNVTATAAGYHHTLVLLNDGTIRGWGTEISGRLGNGVSTDTIAFTPVSVTGITNAVAIAAGNNHSMALLSDGTVWSWGYNYFGQLGDGTYDDSSIPVQVTGITNAIAVAAGSSYSVALLTDGTIKVWGYGLDGRLGNGTTPLSTTSPTQVSDISTAKAIASSARSTHIIALLADGTLRSWGPNGYGQLGDGNIYSSSSTPVTVSGLTGITITAIAVGGRHSLAVASDGTLWSWGDNSSGQLGLGHTTSPISAATQAGVDTDWESIVCGDGHSHAIKTDGIMWTWGNNGGGELGDGTTTQRNIPTMVAGQ